MTAELAVHIHRLRRYALLLCRDAHDADDLVQETLERALARADTFRPGGDLRVWLFAILHNRYVSGRRAYARRREAGALCAALSDIPAEPPQEARHQLGSVLALVDRLPEEQRQVLLLVAVDGLGTDRIARILDLPVGTVRSRLGRARESLRQLTDRPRPARKLRLVSGGGDA